MTTEQNQQLSPQKPQIEDSLTSGIPDLTQQQSGEEQEESDLEIISSGLMDAAPYELESELIMLVISQVRANPDVELRSAFDVAIVELGI